MHTRAFIDEADISVAETTLTKLNTIDARLSQDLISDEGLICNVPFSKNDFFIERDNELTIIHTYLNPKSKCQRNRVCVIHSMSGIGKTQLALEYTYRYRPDYDCIF